MAARTEGPSVVSFMNSVCLLLVARGRDRISPAGS